MNRRDKKERRGREMPFAENAHQQYARVTTMLGNNRVRAKFSDGSERLCKIRGSMRRREWVRVGDVVLVATRELAGDTGDIIFRYQPAEVARLRKLGELGDIALDEDEATMNEHVVFAEEACSGAELPPARQGDGDWEWETI